MEAFLDDTPVIFRWRDPAWPRELPSLIVIFKEHPEKNEEFTAANGYDTFDNVLVAYVSPPGQTRSSTACEIERRLPDGTMKVNQANARKYGDVVRLYKEGKGAGAAGTPLKELGLDPGIVATMRARGIHSIEMLAEISDSAGDELMGFRGFREKAQKYIALREKEAPTKRLEAELKQRDDVIASLQRQLDDLKAAVAAADIPTKRGPGRPRKVVEPEAEAA